MPEANNGSEGARSIRISSDSLPASQRVEFFADFFAQKILRIHLEATRDEPLKADLTLKALPGLGIVWGKNSPISTGPTKDADDGFVFQLAFSDIVYDQFGREGMVHRGEAVALSNADAGRVIFPGNCKFVSLFLPRSLFGPLVREGDTCFARSIAQDSPALQLLRGYLGLLRDDALTGTRELQSLISEHVYDLVALALGAMRDAAEVAKGRGARVARLAAIKKDIVTRLEDDLSLDDLASRHHLSPRYIRMLFEGEGSNFTTFVRDQRLSRAHAMLGSLRFDHRRIADIAYDVGFNDLSYFNRLFRRRFGLAPGEIRDRRKKR